MMQRMEKLALEHCAITKNELREDVKSWVYAGKIRAAISVATGTTLESNEVLKISSTHRALTPDKKAKIGDRIGGSGGFIVDYIIPGRTYDQLFLTREEALP